tara:strand:+ start:392 stop:607 length:216 start_codon:yes stop_codon:yes gene_type:complete
MPKTKKEEEEEWAELYQKYKDSKADSLAQSFKKLNNEKDDFEKMWIEAGQAVYDKSGNLLPDCKKAPKKRN